MIEHKNTILAIVLSLIVVVGWNFFIAKPQIERQQHEAQLKQQEQTQLQQPQPGGAPATPANRRALPAGQLRAPPLNRPRQAAKRLSRQPRTFRSRPRRLTAASI